MSEKSIVNSILKYLNSLPQCRAEKTWGGGYGNAGKPDITGCLSGRRFELEVKVPGGKLTPLQKVTLEQWKEAGAIVAVVHSVEEVKEILKEAKCEK
jgi:hypothetical protein